MAKSCLECHYFKVEDLQSGVCRLAKGTDAPRPLRRHGDSCEHWRDCGQQYHIRLGWLRAQGTKDGNPSN